MRSLQATERTPSIRSSSRYFPAPGSYTARTSSRSARMAARSCCGDRALRAIAHGARLAEPGEFTLRAFLNGRIDLPQAEAVADLIDAVTPLQARAAFDQIERHADASDRRDRRGAVRSGRAARGVGRLSRRGLSLRRSRERSASAIDGSSRRRRLLARGAARPADSRRAAGRRSSARRTSASRACSTRWSARPRDRHRRARDDARSGDRGDRSGRTAGDAGRHGGPAGNRRPRRGRRRLAIARRRSTSPILILSWSDGIAARDEARWRRVSLQDI